MRKYTVAACQMDSQADKEANIAQAEALIQQAAEKGAVLAALPEFFNCLGGDAPAESMEGPSVTAIRKAAQKNGIWVNCGSFKEENPGGLPYNTSVLIDDRGEIAASYRKLHLFDIDLPGRDSAYESASIAAGRDIVNVDTPFGNMGLTICYDIRFPELYRILALRGAQVIFAPANFLMNTGKDHWAPLLQARAIENGCYIVAPCQTGKKPKSFSLGKTLVADPWGNIVSRANEGVGIALAEIDLDYLDRIRTQIPSLKNRRSDVYALDTVK